MLSDSALFHASASPRAHSSIARHHLDIRGRRKLQVADLLLQALEAILDLRFRRCRCAIGFRVVLVAGARDRADCLG